MPDEHTPGATPAVAPGNSTPAPAATNPPELQAGDGQEQISLEEARKLRKEAASLRSRLKGYEDKDAADAAAKLSETERLQQQHAKLQADHDTAVRQYQERLVRYEVEKQALKAGVRPEAAEDVAKLLDWSELEFDGDGLPKNAEDVLKKLLKNKPYLTPQSQEAPPNSSPAQPGTPTIPAMNPGRSSIPSPTNKLPPGQRYKLSDLLRSQ